MSREKILLTRPSVLIWHWLFLVRGGIGPSSSKVWSTYVWLDVFGQQRSQRNGSLLRHYSPWPTLYSLGVNILHNRIPMEHNICLSLFRSHGTVVAVLFFLSTPAFLFYRHCPSFTPASLLVGNTPSYGSGFFSSWEERWSGRIAFPSPHLPGFLCSALTIGSVGFSLYLLLVSCVFMLVSIDGTPTEACLQMSCLLLSKQQWTNFCQASGKPMSREPMQM